MLVLKRHGAKMTGKTGKTLLEGAYKLATPDDNLAYYCGIAARYDQDFVEGLGYSYPTKVAARYRALAGADDVPVADIGCGTGLVGAALRVEADGIDLSPDMLAVARRRCVYRTLHEVDLTGDLAGLPRDYGAVVSAGTFTHGHLGPQVLTALLDLARPGALFVIGVNSAHFAKLGFEAELQRLRAAGRIGAVTAQEVAIYDRDGHEHSEDRALVLDWRLV